MESNFLDVIAGLKRKVIPLQTPVKLDSELSILYAMFSQQDLHKEVMKEEASRLSQPVINVDEVGSFFRRI